MPMHARCTRRTLTTIPACGHFAEMEKPDAVAKLTIDFLSRTN